jgi:hypothetical protein
MHKPVHQRWGVPLHLVARTYMLLPSRRLVFENLEGFSALLRELLRLTGHLMNLIFTSFLLPVQLIEYELCV